MNLQTQPFPGMKSKKPDAYLLVDEETSLVMGLIVRLSCIGLSKNGEPVPGWTLSQIKDRDTADQTFVEMKDRAGNYLVAETPEKAIIEFVTWHIGKL